MYIPFIILSIDWPSLSALAGLLFGGVGLLGLFKYLVKSGITENTLKERDQQIIDLKSQLTKQESRAEKEADEFREEIRDLKKIIEAKNEAIMKLK